MPPPDPVMNYHRRGGRMPVEGGPIANIRKRDHEQIETGMLSGVVASVDEIHFPIQKPARQRNVMGACIYDDKPGLRQETLENQNRSRKQASAYNGHVADCGQLRQQPPESSLVSGQHEFLKRRGT